MNSYINSNNRPNPNLGESMIEISKWSSLKKDLQTEIYICLRVDRAYSLPSFRANFEALVHAGSFFCLFSK